MSRADAASGADGSPSDATVVADAAGFDAHVNDASPIDGGFVDAGFADSGQADAGTTTSTVVVPRPVIFIHGIGGNSGEYAVMIDRLVADGWPRDWLVAIDFPRPRWGCNVDNADIIQDTVQDVLTRTGQARVDIVAHSMGIVSSRHYIKNLGGTAFVNTYVTLGGMHHGVQSSCLNPLPVCVWEEICPTKPFLMDLNADPATPGMLYWVSIFSTDDDRIPIESSMLDGAENILLTGPTHAGATGLLESQLAYVEVLRVLRYPLW